MGTVAGAPEVDLLSDSTLEIIVGDVGLELGADVGSGGGDVGLELGADVGDDVQTGFKQGSSSGFSSTTSLQAAHTHTSST